MCERRAAQEVFAWPNGRRIFGWYVDSTISRQPLPNNSMGKYLRFVGLGLGLGLARSFFSLEIRPFEKDYVNIWCSDFIVFGTEVFRSVM